MNICGDEIGNLWPHSSLTNRLILLDLSHTSHSGARTGIQKVCRSLERELAVLGVGQPVTWDPHWHCWRTLEAWEQASLRAPGLASKRGANWPLAARLRGATRRWTGVAAPSIAAANGLLVPEIYSPKVASSLPQLFRQVRGPKVALFHDAIALKYPELSAPGTVARFPAYLRELAAFDGIAAVSEDSRQSLLEYWDWLGLNGTPPVETIPLGIDLPKAPRSATSATMVPTAILCVGSIEGRKNHVSLLRAAERLWSEGRHFSLQLIGLAQRETGAEALRLIDEFQAKGRPLVYRGPATDEELEAAYRSCSFTVYPSLIEGFGLPVLESLSRGKPCICSAKGALGESARGGGCLALDSVDEASLAQAMKRLLTDEAELSRLRTEAASRLFRTWSDYTQSLLAWMNQLNPIPSPLASRL